MSREAHVRFCESLGLQCPGPLDLIRKHDKCVKKKASKAHGRSTREGK
jgi:hypothetical protein